MNLKHPEYRAATFWTGIVVMATGTASPSTVVSRWITLIGMVMVVGSGYLDIRNR